MPNSYKDYRSSRPAHYRTPSPPWDAVEPISPIATYISDGNPPHDRISPSARSRASQTQPDWEPSTQGHGDRSDGSMEIFVEIALSAQRGLPFEANYSKRKRSLNGTDTSYSPSKRAKSEKLPSPELSRKQITTATRPATSHEQTSQCRMMDAELLLNFSHAARLTYASPDAPSSEINPRFPLPQREHPLDTRNSRPVRRQTKEDYHANDLLPRRKDDGDEPRLHSSSHAQVEKLGLAAPKISSIEHDGMGAAIVGSEDRHANVASQYSVSGDLPTQETTEHGAPRSHSPPIGSLRSSRSDQISAAVENRNRFEPAVGNATHRKQKLDPSINIKDAESPNTLSASFCTACNFQRNQSCVEAENNATSWISCDGCKAWFHFACAGFKNEREVRAVDKFRCKKCKPLFGATTYVRKSSRAHSAIDYAGLHQGVIKTSDERMEHHYIQPIKDGIITFLPENFARMRPELVTAEFFAKNGGMKEPIVIPADLNPRPKSAPSADTAMTDIHADPMELNQVENFFDDDFERQYIPDEGQDALDMVIPQGLTVRKVAELYGPDEKVEVIDVKSQNGENKKWNMRRWAEYYENPNNKVVRNVISLEVSQSKLGRLIRRPKIVRDLDLQDAVWPEELLAKGEYPHVQFYCLMSVADCFTDFHIDFGGSSVFYHILQGKKTFLFIPPKEKHLKKYEEWCMSPAQNWTFLADQTKECFRVDLFEGDTMLIPSGWIHAVWTPEDSLVIGGNFLTRMNFGMQLRISQVEKATGVARKFRYPHFQKLHWYTALHYMDRDPLPEDLKEELYRGEVFPREQPIYYDFDAWGENSRPGKRNYNARYYSQGEIEGFRDLTAYLLRTVLIDLGLISEGITTETRNAVKKSIPRSRGEPLDIVKNFAAWCAWKQGDELLPHWAYPDAKLEDNIPPEKLSVATMKKLDREAAKAAALQAPRRQSIRRQSLQDSAIPPQNIADELLTPPNHQQQRPDDIKYASSTNFKDFSDEICKTGRSLSSVGSGHNRKTACEACRKRRRACKHKDQVVTLGQLSPPNPIYNVFSQDKSPVAESNFNVAVKEGPNPKIDGVIGAVLQTSRTSNGTVEDSPHLIQPQSKDGSEEALQKLKDENDDGLAPGSSGTGLSRPRTKACNDCRKSKRRCIHDAFGNEDPVKVAEQVIPRPHARKSHKFKNAETLPKAMNEQIRPKEQLRNTVPLTDTFAPNLDKMEASQSIPQCLPVTLGGLPHVGITDGNFTATVSRANANIDEAQVPIDQSVAESVVVEKKLQHITRDEHQPKDSVHNEPTTRESHSATEQAPVSSSLISPPASSNDDIGSSPINAAMLYSPSPPPSKAFSKEAPKEARHRYTPESGSTRRASSSSFEQRRHDHGPRDAKELSLGAPGNEFKTAMISADQESLRLIKELQVQEHGLRKRGKF